MLKLKRYYFYFFSLISILALFLSTRFTIKLGHLIIRLSGALGNHFVTIVIITLVFRLIQLPLSYLMHQDKIKTDRIKERKAYIKKKEGLQKKEDIREMEKQLFAEEKTNPLKGCGYLLIQLPIIIVVINAIVFSTNSFPEYFIWKDLNSSDPYFILPIIVGVLVFIQAILDKGDADGGKIVAIKVGFMLVISIFFPVSILIFFIISTTFSLFENFAYSRF